MTHTVNSTESSGTALSRVDSLQLGCGDPAMVATVRRPTLSVLLPQISVRRPRNVLQPFPYEGSVSCLKQECMLKEVGFVSTNAVGQLPAGYLLRYIFLYPRYHPCRIQSDLWGNLTLRRRTRSLVTIRLYENFIWDPANNFPFSVNNNEPPRETERDNSIFEKFVPLGPSTL